MTDEKLNEVLQGLSKTTCMRCHHFNSCHFRRTVAKSLGSWGDTKNGIPFLKLGEDMYAKVWLYGLAYFCNYFEVHQEGR